MNDTPTTDKPDFRCVVDFDLYQRALTIASRDETRYYISGVHIEPHKDGGALLVATNGHSLICLYDRHAHIEGGTGIVKIETAAQKLARKEGKYSGGVQCLLVANKRAVITSLVQSDREQADFQPPYDLTLNPNYEVDAYQWRNPLIDGNYPDWRRVLPKCDGLIPTHSTFDNNILNSVVKALRPKGEGAYFRAFTAGENEAGPTLVRTPDVNGFGVIMPVRCGIEPEFPTWFGEGC